MTAMTLAHYRNLAGVTKPVMAAHMGLPLRTYENIESGQSEFRTIHANAARWALIEIAIGKDDASILPRGIADLIAAAANLLQMKKAGS